MKLIKSSNVIDQSRINSFHILLIFWLFVVITFDGYDVVIYGATVPSLINEWGITDVTAGAIGSYTVIGTAVGAVIFGMLSDRIGRKKIILLTTFLFSFFTFLAGFANGPVLFTLFRIIAGIGLGGVMPNVIALATEFAPKRIRTATVSFIFCGYSIGAMIAALVSRSIIPVAGWEQVYLLGGLPLIIIPFLMKYIPDSIDFLVENGKENKARKIISKIDPEIGETVEITFEKPERRDGGFPVIKLFEEKRARSTIMFWISCFSAFLLIYSMNTWLPRLLMEVGYDLKSSLTFTAFMQLGAIMGSLIFGPLVDRIGFRKVLIPLFFCGAIALTLIGFTTSTVLMFTLIAVVGASSIGLQNLSNAFVSQYYPSTMRSTALGSTMAFGRIGGIIAPTVIGFLLAMNFLPQFNFAAIGLAAVLGGVAMLFVQEKHADFRREPKVDKEIPVVKLAK